uniref:uncharacterized protein LOC122581666 n=1 Tax=Erigeron canadensis TaxID=72917 RepID=UPI001CB90C5E|nr:uncharacterized protein LOC122581666 [Erigeron canadensis]
MDRRTYWCHQCDMSISLIPTTLTTITSCPHCTSDVLAELDSPITFNTQNNDTTTLIFDSPYFHHVINQLFNNNFDHDDNTNNNDHLSKGDNIKGIKSVKITKEVLGNDHVVICAICKEMFEINDDVKELPCKHMYHPSCIIPWLLIRNSCPLCRYEIPVQEEEEEEKELKVRRRSSSSLLRAEVFMDEEHDTIGEEELFGFGLRHFARRNRVILPMRHNDELPQMQVDEEEVEVGDSGTTGNLDNGSSWPNWPVVDGDEIAMGNARVNDDFGVIIS